MTLIRIPGVEALLGQPVDEQAGGAISRLVAEQVAESQQLDWKREMYGSDDSAKRELAKDICAMANASGGVIVIGVAEVAGKASRSMPIEIADADLRRLRSVVASWTAPIPRFDLVRAEVDDGRAYLAIVVPPSSMAPHGVNAPGDEALRFPVRRGSQTDWLTEPELANTYRARFAAIEDRTRQIGQIAIDARRRYPQDACTLTLCLVPMLPGRSEISFAALAEAKQWTRTALSAGFARQHRFKGLTTRPGSGRIELTASFNAEDRYGSAGLYIDGSGTATREIDRLVPNDRPIGVDGQYDYILDEANLCSIVVDGLELLVLHATDRCGASGQALASLTIDAGPVGPTMRVVHSRHDGIFNVEMGAGPLTLPYSNQVGLDLTAMRTSSQSLLHGVRLLIEDLMHTVGTAEPYPIDSSGRVRRAYASPDARNWAQARGVPLTDEEVNLN